MSETGSDLLIKAIDECYQRGLDAPEAAPFIEKYLADRNYHITENWLVRENRQKAEYKAREDARKAATLAKAIPYAGAIKDCQATVWSQGRGAIARRCQKKARFVVRQVKYGNDEDGRLAVCRTHASDPASRRYVKHWSHEVSAAEPVEPEYQLEGEQA